MENRFIIGRGELLTYGIEAPRKKASDKRRPYTLDEAKKIIVPQIEAAAETLDQLPAAACPNDIAVAKLTLHPAYLAKSYFPAGLLRQARLVSVGSRTERIKPRKQVRASGAAKSDTTQLFLAGTRKAFHELPTLAQALDEQSREGKEFAEIEWFAAMLPEDRVKRITDDTGHVFEVGLHLLPDESPIWVRKQFMAYAAQLGFKVNMKYEFQAGRMLFLPVEGSADRIHDLARFTLVRVIRSMPRIRSARPMPRSITVPIKVELPSDEPLSGEPRVAVLDGGLPGKHAIERYVKRYFPGDENAADVDEYLGHGLGVTSAFLFGPIEPGTRAERPFSPVYHHRILDASSADEDPYELYRTLGHIENVLTARLYQFVNLSLGPDLPIDDQDVHAWTAVIDELLSDGDTLMTIAVGNNGEYDHLAGNDRIQVPSDCVNALSVGAANHAGSRWNRAPYSAKGPGRVPGRRKPDVVAFGGSPKEYFHHLTPGQQPQLAANCGTSFAAPYVLRSAVGIRSILGNEIQPLTIKALLIHSCDIDDTHEALDVGWGRIPSDINRLITCRDGMARIIYHGVLRPGKFLRAPVPLPAKPLTGMVTLTATFCYACPVDPQDASAYTKAGLGITFRPHEDRRKPPTAMYPASKIFFPANEFRTEAEQRDDLGKWEPVLHGSRRYRASSLKGSVFDIHYNARDGGGVAESGAEQIHYALVLSLEAPKHSRLYEDILNAHGVLKAIEPQITLPIRT